MSHNINFKREFSAGCVVYKTNNEFLFLLGKHSGYHKWALPKGLIEEGEKGWQTAVRETEEEMGVKVRLVTEKPIYVEKYIFYANYKDLTQISKSKFLISKWFDKPLGHELGAEWLTIPSKVEGQTPNPKKSDKSQSSRRVEKYKESFGPAQDKKGKTKVFKTVSFYLAEYESGDPKNHGWEMEEAGWFDYEKALAIMSFKGEKEALKKANEQLQELEKQPLLL